LEDLLFSRILTIQIYIYIYIDRVSFDCGTWFLKKNEEPRSMMSEIRALKRIFRLRREKIQKDGEIVHTDELNNCTLH
jgi:hypothetical protein